MRAWVLEQPGPPGPDRPLVARERPDPQPGPGEVLVEVEACAVCRTDLQLVTGDLPARRLPVVPGHQVVGRVVARAADVEEPSVGSRVGIAWIASTCGHCRFCLCGRENLCMDARLTGWDRDGGYATHVTARADFVHPLPDGLAPEHAAPLLCGGAIGLRSLRVAGVEPGMRLGLFGFGASAGIVVQVAAQHGVEVLVATRSPDEQARALRLGAAWAGSYDDPLPRPLDAAITFAPVGWVVVRALQALDRGGIVAVNAIHLDEIPAFDYDDLWWERQIRSVANVTRGDVRDLLALAPDLTVDRDTVPLDDANDALSRLAAGRVRGTVVLVP